MTHGLDTSVVVRIISGLPEGAAEKVDLHSVGAISLVRP